MLSGYNSAARPVEKRSMAALHIPYTVPPRPANGPGGMVGCRAAPEEMLRIQPPPCARMPGSTSWARWNDASTCTENISAYRLWVKSSTRVKYVTAALLTRMSGVPSRLMVSATRRSRSCGLARSAVIATAVPPAAWICCAVSAMVPSNCETPGSAVLAATATAAPSAANRLAISAPIPRLAPVTIATLPSSSPIPVLRSSGWSEILEACSTRPLDPAGLTVSTRLAGPAGAEVGMPLNHSVVGVPGEPQQRSWTSTDALLYAIGVGAGLGDPLQELQFTTENTAGVQQQVLPTFGVLLAQARAGG